MTHSNCDYDQGGVHAPLPSPAELVAAIDSESQGGSLSPVVYLSWAHQTPKDSSQAMVQLGGHRNKIAKKKKKGLNGLNIVKEFGRKSEAWHGG